MIFVGLKMMSSACDDQSIRDAFSNVLKNLEFPLLLELLGVIFTAIIQSFSNDRNCYSNGWQKSNDNKKWTIYNSRS
jgi:hypothetical protein